MQTKNKMRNKKYWS